MTDFLNLSTLLLFNNGQIFINEGTLFSANLKKKQLTTVISVFQRLRPQYASTAKQVNVQDTDQARRDQWLLV